MQLDVAALRHFQQMPHRAEAGHVRAGVDAILDHDVARGLVQRGHHAIGKTGRLVADQPGLHAGGQHADADRLREENDVTRLRAGVRQNAVGMHKARHGEAVFRLVVKDAVATRDECSGLIDLVIAAAQNVVHDLPGHVLRDGHDVQRKLRLAAHGVDVREGVRRGDRAEGIRVVGDGRKKIDRLHERQLVGDLIDRGVVAAVKADQQVRVFADADALEELRQHARADLRAAPGAFCKLRQFYFVFHVLCSVPLISCIPAISWSRPFSAASSLGLSAKGIVQPMPQSEVMLRGTGASRPGTPAALQSRSSSIAPALV